MVGTNCFIHGGVTIGNNCIIGACSVVTKDIPDGMVAAGIPAKVICTIEEYYEKNLSKGNFYDTTGFEQFQGIIPKQYIRDSHIVLLVFSDIETLNDIKKRWYIFYKTNANIENSKFILIGNKSDIFGNEKEEIIRQGQEFAEEIDAHFITCSAKSADNMDNVENFIISEAKRFIDEALEILREINNNKQINLNKKNANRNNDCNC